MQINEPVILTRRYFKIVLLFLSLLIIFMLPAAQNINSSQAIPENTDTLSSPEIVLGDNTNQNNHQDYFSLTNEINNDYSENSNNPVIDIQTSGITLDSELPELTNLRHLSSEDMIESIDYQNYPYGEFVNSDIEIPEWRTLPYLIYVSLDSFTIAVLGLDENGDHTKLIHTWNTAYGRTNAQTRPGTYEILSKTPWIEWRNGMFSPFGSRYVGNLWFHAPLFYRKDLNTMRASTFNQIGTRATAGCFRTSTEAAAWIYNNVPIGTRVVVANDSFFTSSEIEEIGSGQSFDPTYPIGPIGEPMVDYKISKVCD